MFSSALRVSLKVLQVGINWPVVKESDIDFHTKVKESDRDEIKAYCMNDVSSTKQITHLNKDALNLRVLIEKSFGIKCTSMDGMSTGVALFAKFYAQDSGDDSFLEKKTERLIIALKDCISDKVVFKSDKFNDLLKTLKNKMISQTKGALNYKVLYGDVMYVFGTGGLHSKDKPGVIIPNEDEILEDADVGSLYPSLLINEKACPEHLDPDKFLPRFTWLRDTRIHAKKNKQTLIADTFKLSLNGTCGNLINEYSWLHDPQAAMTITLNGQLYLAMLGERLTDAGFQIISINTDGITTRVKKVDKQKYLDICNTWEKELNLELEYQTYKKIVRRDVNTYFAEFANGYIKEKGDFLTTVILGKGYNKPIIAKALKAYYFENIPILDFIKNHDNIYDFCMMQKIGGQFRAKHNGKFIQKVNRYFATVDPTQGYLKKVKKEDKSESHILKDSGVTIFNDYVKKDMKDYRINYPYYISQAEKMRSIIEPAQLSLF